MRVQYRVVWTMVRLAIVFLAALLITSTAGSATCVDEDPTHCPTLDAMGCYDNMGPCCLSCSKFSTNLTGCEYGDKRNDCSAEVCSYAPTNYTNFQQECCWTCHQLNLSATSVSTLTAAITTGASVPVKATATITVSLDTTAPPLITKRTPPTLPNLTQPPTSTTTSTTTTSPPVVEQSSTTTSTQSTTSFTSTITPQPSTTAATSTERTSVTTSATSTASTTNVPVSLTSSSDAPVNGASSSSQNQVIIGAAVGACLGVLLLVAIIVITVCCIKKRRKNQQQQNGYKNRMAESVLRESDVRQSGPKARPISEVVSSATVRGGASNFDKNKTYGATDTNTITPRTMYLSVGGKSAYDLMQEQDGSAGQLDDQGQGQDQGHQGQGQVGPSYYNNGAYDYVNNDGSDMNNPVATTSAAGLGGDADYVNTSNPESGSENELTTSSNLNFRF